MEQIWEWFRVNALALAALLGALASIIKYMGSVKKALMKPLTDIKAQNDKQEERLKRLDEDTADLLCAHLTREHDYYVTRGWCPTSDKQRFDSIYTRYKSRGRNHVASTYMDDIIALPTQPTQTN